MIVASRPRISSEFLRFAVAGTVGFAVDSALLIVLATLVGWPHLLARLVSFSIALLTTWLINRIWTFRKPARGFPGLCAELAGYAAVQLAGGAANYVAYAVIVAFTGTSPAQLLAALAAGSIVGLVINYLGARRFVFASSADRPQP